MSLTKVNDQWVPLQKKVFTRWVNSQLKSGNNAEIGDISKDLSNGVALVELAQTLTKKDTPRPWKKEPKRNVDQVMNCDLSVDMFTKDGVKLIGISGKDVNDNNEKLILGYVWSLILHYSIGGVVSEEKDNNGTAKKPAKNALLEWAIGRTSEYPNVNKFQPYDLSMCALLDSYVPDKINYYKLNPQDSQHNAQLATDVMEQLDIPVYVMPDDLEANDGKVDEKTLLTQLAAAKKVLDNLKPVQKADQHQLKPKKLLKSKKLLKTTMQKKKLKDLPNKRQKQKDSLNKKQMQRNLLNKRQNKKDLQSKKQNKKESQNKKLNKSESNTKLK